MLDEDDLDAAVAEGVLNASQAAALRDFALKRQKERVAVYGPEERFRFMRGFSDFFFAVGIVLLFAGIAYFTYRTPAACLADAVLAWLLAELLVARMRLVLPGILLSCLFAGFVVMASPVEPWLLSATWIPDFAALADWFISERLQPPTPFLFIPSLLFYGVIGTLAAALFYLRFRLPFALLLIGAGLVVTVLLTVDRFWPNAAGWMLTLTMLGCGVGVFAVAMCFDTSDRERVTRLSDCAFWLHLLAAPLIVHSLIALVTRDLAKLSAPEALAVFVIFAVLTIVAITIDRRALLVSGLTYIGAVIAYGITQATGAAMDQPPFVVYATLAVLGAMVLIIGVGWMPLRRLFVAILPANLAGRLPPAPARA